MAMFSSATVKQPERRWRMDGRLPRVLQGGPPMKPLTIYVSGPYSAPKMKERWNNVMAAVTAGILIRKKGHFPLIPHLYDDFDTIAKMTGYKFEWQDYMEMDLAFLEKCDALYFIGSSKGADIELARAKELGLKIYYSLDEVPDLIKN